MRVIVTGAASFIGSAVVRKLLDDGNSICAVVRPGSESTACFERMLAKDYPDSNCDVSAPKVHVLELDLQNIEKLPELLADSFTDTMFGSTLSDSPYAAGSESDNPAGNASVNIASPSWNVFLHAGWEGAGSANREKEDVQQSNVTQTLAALRTAAELGCRRFVFTGSQAEYGIVNGAATEETPTNPVSPYGKAKVAVSQAALPLSRELGIEYIHARLYSIYGPGDHPWSLVSSCLHAWKHRDVIELGPCTQKWNFLYVDDAAAALCTLLKEGSPGFYNVAGEDTRPLADYIKEMARICSAEGLYTFGDRPQNAEGAADLIPDISKIIHDTSWRPKTSFRDGISRMWEMEDLK